MTRAEFLVELKRPGTVWVFVNVFGNDGVYIQANKSHLLEIAQAASGEAQFEAERRDNGLYID